jgi:hypothetical protein
MQGADRVNEELEVGFDEKFEQRWLWGQRVGRVVMVVFTLAGLAGVLGRGPYSHRSLESASSGLKVDFEPIARSQTGTQVTLHLSNPTLSPTEDIFLSDNAVEPMGLTQIIPAPELIATVANGLLLTVAVPPGTQDAKLRLMLMPVGIGQNELVARLNGGSPLHWQQLVLP